MYFSLFRFVGEVERVKSNLPMRKKVIPESEEAYPRHRIPPVEVDPENVFLCRQVYDIKLKRVLKNPSWDYPTWSSIGLVVCMTLAPVTITLRILLKNNCLNQKIVLIYFVYFETNYVIDFT